MNPSRPYLVRALQEWILDNSCTPHLAVDAHIQGLLYPLSSCRTVRLS
nr:hypothetical protein [Aliamphritea spongicola]